MRVRLYGFFSVPMSLFGLSFKKSNIRNSTPGYTLCGVSSESCCYLKLADTIPHLNNHDVVTGLVSKAPLRKQSPRRYAPVETNIGKMMSQDPEIEFSEYCEKVSSGGITLSVDIYRIKDTHGWSLEIVDEYGNSTVWDDLFDSDMDAITEAKRCILEETAAAFVGPSDGKSHGEWS